MPRRAQERLGGIYFYGRKIPNSIKRHFCFSRIPRLIFTDELDRQILTRRVDRQTGTKASVFPDLNIATVDDKRFDTAAEVTDRTFDLRHLHDTDLAGNNEPVLFVIERIDLQRGHEAVIERNFLDIDLGRPLVLDRNNCFFRKCPAGLNASNRYCIHRLFRVRMDHNRKIALAVTNRFGPANIDRAARRELPLYNDRIV